jgi:hypothetical protein
MIIDYQPLWFANGANEENDSTISTNRNVKSHLQPKKVREIYNYNFYTRMILTLIKPCQLHFNSCRTD